MRISATVTKQGVQFPSPLDGAGLDASEAAAEGILLALLILLGQNFRREWAIWRRCRVSIPAQAPGPSVWRAGPNPGPAVLMRGASALPLLTFYDIRSAIRVRPEPGLW